MIFLNSFLCSTQDIRSFFSVAKSSAAPAAPKSAQKRKTAVLDDSDDELAQTHDKPKKSPAKHSTQSKKRRVLYSSDEDEPKPKSQDTSGGSTLASKAAKLKAVNVTSAFGSAPVKRIEKEKKPKMKAPVDVFDADTDDMELMQVDEALLSPKSSKRKSTHNEEIEKKTDKHSPKKEKSSYSEHQSKHTPKKENAVLKTKNDKTPEKKVKIEKKSPEVKVEKKVTIKKEENDSPKDDKKKKTPKSSKKKPAKTEDDDVDLDASIYDADQERLDKRRAAAALYQQRLKRKDKGPANPGSKEIPVGKPKCLEGLAFVLTGEFDSMERDEAKQVIVDLGGRVTTAISGKTNYIVAGEDAGPAKLAKADDMKIQVLTEDELLDLIRVKSGIPPLNSNSSSTEATTSSKTPTKKSSSHEKSDKSSQKSEKCDKSPAKIKIEKKDKEIDGNLSTFVCLFIRFQSCEVVTIKNSFRC